MTSFIELTLTPPLATIALNRPESHNAFNPQLIAGLTEAFQTVGQDETVRVVILTGRGRSFCAGADVSFMHAAASYTFAENLADSQAIFDLMNAVDSCPKPVIGRINGAAIGGGAGLVSCCDIVVAVERATFAFSEVRLGIIPAVISPFVLAKIGVSQGRELFLTGERFSAAHARHIGLVHHLAADEAALDEKVGERVEQLLLAAPGASAAAKQLIRTVAYQPKEAMRETTAQLIAHRRASPEGQEGLRAFLEKRPPGWQ
ncbi:MAG: enoyl-CoA hydratase/isomerase family protein [Anaerolineae bacterium]|nr:enoyl-CoA hydratase/isomerase family protein [Anaerolineae bacterium]